MKTFKTKFWNTVAFKASRDPENLRIDNVAEFAFGQGYAKGFGNGTLWGTLITLGVGYVAYTWYQVGKSEATKKCQKKLDEAADELNKLVDKYSKKNEEIRQKISKKPRVNEKPEEKQKDDESQQ